MGTVFRKSFTKPIPASAEIIVRQGERIARWKDAASGKTRTAPVTGNGHRIRLESSNFHAKLRDGAGLLVERPTGCRTEAAARQVLAEWEREAERIRAGLITPAEAKVAEHLALPIGDHFDAYLDALEGRGAVQKHRDGVRGYLLKLANECRFQRLSDLQREPVEQWLNREAKAGRSARSRNAHRAAIVGFANWCVEMERLIVNPLAKVPVANEAADRRRLRRAMTEDDLVRLLDVARRRPLEEALLIRRGRRKGELVAKIRPEVRAELDLLGRERAIIYKTLVLTGLRKNELTSIKVGQLNLDAAIPYLELAAADEKNRTGSDIPIRADLAEDLRAWLSHKLSELQARSRERGEPVPDRLPADMKVLTVPAGLLRILDRDLEAAGIPKFDERGRSIDIHALRHTFGTLLSRGGVPLRTAQAAMRHSTPTLTANVYTDPKLLDVGGALDALPQLPLDGQRPDPRQSRALKTGTSGNSPLAPLLAPAVAKSSITESIPDNLTIPGVIRIESARIGENMLKTHEKRGTGMISQNPLVVETKRIELSTSCVQSREHPVVSDATKGLTDNQSFACTTACTSGPEIAKTDPLAGFVASLTPEQRRRLVALLIGSEGDPPCSTEGA